MPPHNWVVFWSFGYHEFEGPLCGAYLMLDYTLHSLIQNKQYVVEFSGLCDPTLDKSTFYVAIPQVLWLLLYYISESFH